MLIEKGGNALRVVNKTGGSNRSAAEKALLVIEHYRMDRACFVGWSDAGSSYLRRLTEGFKCR